MKITPIVGPTFGIKVNKKENPRKYLFNEMLQVTNDLRLPANFTNKYIEFPTVTKELIEKLKELKILWR